MKKFNALFFAMTLLVLVAFASGASAADTQLLGVDAQGYFKVLTVNSDGITDGGGLSRTGGDFPGKLRDGNHVRLFSYGDGNVAVVHGDTSDETIVYYISTASGTINLDRTFGANNGVSGNGADINALKTVLTIDGSPVFITAERIGPSPVEMQSASVDVAFVYDSKFYVIAPVSLDVTGSRYRLELQKTDVGFKDATYDTTSGETIRELVSVNSSGLQTYEQTRAGAIDGSNYTQLSGDACFMPSVILGNTLYFIPPTNLAEDGGLYSATLASEGQTMKVAQGLTLSRVANNRDPDRASTAYAFDALYKLNDTTIYAVATYSDKDTELRSNRVVVKLTLTDGELKAERTGLSSANGISANGSFDVFGNNDVIVVVHHYDGNNGGVAAYDASTLKLLGTNPVRSAAMISPVSSGSNSNNGGDSTSSTVKLPADLASGAAIANTMGVAASAFVNADEAAAPTSLSPTARANLVKELDINEEETTLTTRQLANYTPNANGSLLVEQQVSASNKAFFVEAEASASSASLAAAGDVTAAKLLNEDGSETTTGNSTYVAANNLKSGTTYTLVTTSTTAKSSNNNNNNTNNNGGTDNNNGSSTSSSSGGGCDAGLGLWALAALAVASKKLSERR